MPLFWDDEHLGGKRKKDEEATTANLVREAIYWRLEWSVRFGVWRLSFMRREDQVYRAALRRTFLGRVAATWFSTPWPRQNVRIWRSKLCLLPIGQTYKLQASFLDFNRFYQYDFLEKCVISLVAFLHAKASLLFPLMIFCATDWDPTRNFDGLHSDYVKHVRVVDVWLLSMLTSKWPRRLRVCEDMPKKIFWLYGHI